MSAALSKSSCSRAQLHLVLPVGRAWAPGGSALPGLCHGQAEFGPWVSASLWLFPPCQAFVTGFPGEMSLGMGRGNQMLPLAAAATGSHGTAAMSEQPAAGEDASDSSLQGGFSLQLPDSLTGSSWSHGEVPLTPLSLQGLAWQGCSRMSSNCWCRSCRRHGSSRHCWRAWPATQSPTSTTSPTASCRWARPCTSSCSGRRPILAPLATTSPPLHRGSNSAFLGGLWQITCHLGSRFPICTSWDEWDSPLISRALWTK